MATLGRDLNDKKIPCDVRETGAVGHGQVKEYPTSKTEMSRRKNVFNKLVVSLFLTVWFFSFHA